MESLHWEDLHIVILEISVLDTHLFVIIIILHIGDDGENVFCELLILEKIWLFLVNKFKEITFRLGTLFLNKLRILPNHLLNRTYRLFFLHNIHSLFFLDLFLNFPMSFIFQIQYFRIKCILNMMIFLRFICQCFSSLS